MPPIVKECVYDMCVLSSFQGCEQLWFASSRDRDTAQTIQKDNKTGKGKENNGQEKVEKQKEKEEETVTAVALLMCSQA